MQIDIGGLVYDLVMVDVDLVHPADGALCDGLTWPSRNLIQIDGRRPPSRRRKIMWHEIGHAFKAELDIHDATQLEEEAFCDLVALALSSISPRLYCRLWAFATTGREAHDVMMMPGVEHPIPVIRYGDPWPGERSSAASPAGR